MFFEIPRPRAKVLLGGSVQVGWTLDSREHKRSCRWPCLRGRESPRSSGGARDCARCPFGPKHLFEIHLPSRTSREPFAYTASRKRARPASPHRRYLLSAWCGSTHRESASIEEPQDGQHSSMFCFALGQLELHEDAAHVLFDCAFGHEDPSRDARIRTAFGH